MSRTSKVQKVADRVSVAANGSKLSAAQEEVLRAAAGPSDGYVPDELRKSRGRSLSRTLAALVRQDLLQPVEGTAEGDAEQAQHRITAAGLRAIGMPDVIPGAGRADAVTDDPVAGVFSSSTKSDLLLSLLRQPEGASIGELMSAASWQAHSIRGFLSATVKKRLGHDVISEKDGEGNRRYRIPG